jgi:hypothetical protein
VNRRPVCVPKTSFLLIAYRQSGRAETIYYLSAFGGKADIGRLAVPIIAAAFDPKRTLAGPKSCSGNANFWAHGPLVPDVP